MKIKYVFPLQARIKMPVGLRFAHADREYEFIVENGQPKALALTISSVPDELLPSFGPIDDPVAKKKVSIPLDSKWDDIVSEVRAIEGGLSLWGVEEIEVEQIKIEWIPESQEDKSKLQLFSFNINFGSKQADLRDAPLDMLIRTIMITPDLLENEVALNFYRRGQADITEGKYIEAIYDLYFVLETLFGKWKVQERQCY